MTKAQANRGIGIGMLNALILPQDASGEYEFATADREFIAASIEKLARLGRTQRWQRAIAAWAAAVRDENNRLHWAYLQYSVYACHAID